MKALISGQAAAAVILGRKPQLRVLDNDVSEGRDLAELLRVFDGCADVQEVSASTLEQIDKLTELAWASDRALKLSLLLLDPSEPVDCAHEYAACINELMDKFDISEILVRRMFSAPLSGFVEVVRVEEACQDAPLVGEFYKRLLSMQSSIQKVASAFEKISPSLFGSEIDKEAFRQIVIDDGTFSELVKSIFASEDIKFLRLKLIGTHRGYSDAIGRWTGLLQPLGGKSQQLPREDNVASSDDWEDDWSEGTPEQSYQAFAQIKAQQISIVEKIKARDLDGARHLTNELIESQRKNSSNEQIAMSLCLLAQQAKRQEIPELQLEWAEWAAEVNPLDPIAHGHFADALIGLGRLVDAESVLDRVEQAGDPCYAATGRARILRAMGRPIEARTAFLAAADAYVDSPKVVFAWVGAVETLRDMGENERALAEYREITERWPLDIFGWAGLASVLMDMGRLDEAIITFGKAASGDRAGIAKNGRAATYKLAGNFDAALKLYDEVIRDFPNNHVSLCGKAEVLRAKGQLGAALEAYEVAHQRAPFSVVPLAGKAGLLREMGRFSEAAEIYNEGSDKFPFDHQLASGFAAVLRDQGKYADALAAYDEVVRKFPFDVSAQTSRAGVLHRLGSSEEALAAYDRVLADRPYASAAITGKASVLLSLQRYKEVEELLPDVRPTSQNDWRRFLLRAYLVEMTDGVVASARLLERGFRTCPFAKESSAMRSALAALELRRNRPREARRLVEAAPLEVSNIVALHILAVTHRPGQAKLRLREIIDREGPPLVIELAKEIARRHRLVDEPPQRPANWIVEIEREILIADAA